MSAFERRLHRVALIGDWLQAWPLDRVRLVMLAGLPLAVLVASPQRVALSALISAAYLTAAVFTHQGRRVNRLLIAYVVAVGALMALSWLRARYLLHLQPDQLAYASAKTGYFVLIVLPMAWAVATMVELPEHIWPAAASQLALGSAVALATVVLLGQHFLGEDRYSWQGDLIALGAAIAVQPWLVRRFGASALLGLLGVAGVMYAGSRQAVVALGLALLLTAAYWAAARIYGPARVRARYIALPLVLFALLGGFLGLTYAGVSGVHLPFGIASSASCHCVTDRFVVLETNAGDRDRLLAHGVQLFLQNPVLGTGLGSFAGAVPDSLHPGTYYPYPHNVLLEVAAETGIVGFLLVFVPLFAAWAVLLRRGMRLASGPIAALAAITAVFFTVANLSGDVPSERGLWIFGLVALQLGWANARLGRNPGAYLRHS